MLIVYRSNYELLQPCFSFFYLLFFCAYYAANATLLEILESIFE
jgi:hypothetical protein